MPSHRASPEGETGFHSLLHDAKAAEDAARAELGVGGALKGLAEGGGVEVVGGRAAGCGGAGRGAATDAGADATITADAEPAAPFGAASLSHPEAARSAREITGAGEEASRDMARSLARAPGGALQRP